MCSDFWQTQAAEHGFDVKAVNFDSVEEELEIYFLKNLFKDDDVVCDIGCGNGRTTLELAMRYPDAKFYGLDSSENMIKSAVQQKTKLGISNVCFKVADASFANLPSVFDVKFSKILTKRLLINVKGDSKREVVKSINAMLQENGTYIMVECFLEPLHKTNEVRKILDLPVIKVKSFNEYLTQDFFDVVEQYFVVEKKIDFGSFYYFTSRVFNAALSEGEPKYDAPINKLCASLIKSGICPIDGYAPENIYILTKKN